MNNKTIPIGKIICFYGLILGAFLSVTNLYYLIPTGICLLFLVIGD